MIWIVLPAYNEEKAIPPLLDSLIETMREDRREFRIVVVNDGSSDGTHDAAAAYTKRGEPVEVLDNVPNRGLSETIRRGLVHAAQAASPKDIVITMDADNTHPAGLMLRMIRLIREGNDVVIASRYREGSHVRGLSRFREFLSFGAAMLFRSLFPIRGVRDYTCGYRAYRATALKDLILRNGTEFTREKGFSCMVDILLQLSRLDLVFAEVPMVLRYDQKPGKSKMQVFKTIRDTLSLLFRRKFGLT